MPGLDALLLFPKALALKTRDTFPLAALVPTTKANWFDTVDDDIPGEVPEANTLKPTPATSPPLASITVQAFFARLEAEQE